jgi:hydrogenase maturation protease
MAYKIAIIGIGNILLQDEGIGVHIINELKGLRLPDNVEVYDCGTGGLSILGLLDGFDKAIVVDAVKGEGEPGAIYRFRLDKISSENKLRGMISLHELDFATAVEIGRKAYKLPGEIFIIGIEPKSIEIGLGVSPDLKRSIPKVIHLIFEEIKKTPDP